MVKTYAKTFESKLKKWFVNLNVASYSVIHSALMQQSHITTHYKNIRMLESEIIQSLQLPCGDHKDNKIHEKHKSLLILTLNRMVTFISFKKIKNPV